MRTDFSLTTGQRLTAFDSLSRIGDHIPLRFLCQLMNSVGQASCLSIPTNHTPGSLHHEGGGPISFTGGGFISASMPQLEHIEAIEKRPWAGADTLRANSNYTSNEYFLPVMGVAWLARRRFAAEVAEAGVEGGVGAIGEIFAVFVGEDNARRLGGQFFRGSRSGGGWL